MAVDGITRMNIAGLDDEALRDLRAYFAGRAENAPKETARVLAAGYLAAVDAELRTREPGAGEPS